MDHAAHAEIEQRVRDTSQARERLIAITGFRDALNALHTPTEPAGVEGVHDGLVGGVRLGGAGWPPVGASAAMTFRVVYLVAQFVGPSCVLWNSRSRPPPGRSGKEPGTILYGNSWLSTTLRGRDRQIDLGDGAAGERRSGGMYQGVEHLLQ